MPKVLVYIGISLDGYIADLDGQVDWMVGDGSNPNHPGTYENFINGIDTIVMGRKTYHQVRTQLSPDHWPYAEQEVYVLTSQPHPDKNKTHFVSGSASDLINQVKTKTQKDIWICGGAQLIQELLNHNLIDRLHLSILPCLLGQGIPLFQPSNKKDNLVLKDTITYNGIVDLVYDVLK